MSPRLTKTVTIVNELGLHARAAAKVAERAGKARQEIWILRDGRQADATSIIDILTLACSKGCKITFMVEDQADMDILDDLVDLVTRGFEE